MSRKHHSPWPRRAQQRFMVWTASPQAKCPCPGYQFQGLRSQAFWLHFHKSLFHHTMTIKITDTACLSHLRILILLNTIFKYVTNTSAFLGDIISTLSIVSIFLSIKVSFDSYLIYTDSWKCFIKGKNKFDFRNKEETNLEQEGYPDASQFWGQEWEYGDMVTENFPEGEMGTWSACVLQRKGRGRLQAPPGILTSVLFRLPYCKHKDVYLGIRVKRYCSEQFFLTRPSCCQNLRVYR